MTTVGWIFMAISWGVILSLVTYCFTKVIRNRNINSQTPIEIEFDDSNKG
ncbi:hypothetical protein KKG05_02160 [bacterium]|nr:hypothetical protein [bacterium]MBU1936177.1 hypothetical protein [bacterium]